MDTNFKLVTKKGKAISITENYEETFMEEYDKCKKIMIAVDKIVTKSVRNIADSAIAAVKENSNIFYIFNFNDDESTGKLLNAKIDSISTRYLLSEEWGSIHQKFNNKPYKSISQRIMDQLKTAKYNNGIDFITKKPYKISVFYYKKDTSKFKNGIMISRDGIIYS